MTPVSSSPFGQRVAASIFTSWLPAAAFAFAFLPAAPGYAQAPAVAVPAAPAGPAASRDTPPAPAPFKSPNTLKDALGMAYWNARARGPLLAVGAENVRPWQPKREPGDWYTPQEPPKPLGPPDQREGYRVDDVAPYFGQRTVRLPSLTAVAPAEMTLLNTELKGKPDPFSGMQSSEKMQLLMATLDAGQWRALGNNAGLGLSDLSREQQQLFLSLVPETIKVIKMKSYPGGGWGPVYSQGENGRMVPTQQTLSGAERQQIRLRLNRQVSVYIPSANDDRRWGASVNSRPVDSEFYQITNVDNYAKPEAYGAKLKAEVPNKLKPGQLDFDAPALAGKVSVAGVKTLGELVERIRRETRVEVYADGRYAARTLTLLGAEEASDVRAGDLLKALCWAVTGAFRKVGDVFVLTNDVEGLGTRRARIADWSEEGQRARSLLTLKAQLRVREQKPLQYLGFAPNDPLALPSELMGRIENSWKQSETRYAGELLRISELPEALRQQARSSIDEYSKSPQQSAQRPILTDRVRLNVRSRLDFLIPGLGEVEANSGGSSLSEMLPPPDFPPDEKKFRESPVVLPPAFAAQNALLIAPDGPDEVRRLPELAAAAKARGVRQLWVTLPLDPAGDREVIAAAVTAAKPHGLSVLPVLRLLMAPATSDPAELALRDRNILGETTGAWAARKLALPEAWPGQSTPFRRVGDWLRPDAPGLLPRLKRRLRDVAAAPGVAGVVLVDVAPPGYRTPDEGDFFFGSGAGEEVGYTPELRAALLREAGYDPVDVPGESYVPADLAIPNFEDGANRRYIQLPNGEYGLDPKAQSPRKTWNRLRHARLAAFLAELHKAFRSEDPNTPLLMREVSGLWGGWYGSWDAADKLPRAPVTAIMGSPEGGVSSVNGAAREASKRVLTQISCVSAVYPRSPWSPPDSVEPGSPAAFRRVINASLSSMKKNGGEKAWDGLVIDMTGVPAANVIGFLRDGMAAPSPAR